MVLEVAHKTSAITVAGYVGTAVANTETWNGTNWAENYGYKYHKI
jgi:hypothetical protein